MNRHEDEGSAEAGALGATVDARVRRRVRWAVLALGAAFVAQVGYITRAEEPYPALMMPRFGWAGPTTPDLEVTDVAIAFTYADGSTRSCDLSELMAPAPDGHRYMIVNNLLSPLDPSAAVSRAPGGKLEPPSWLFPGYNLVKISRREASHRQSLARWLSARAQVMFGMGQPRACTASWYSTKYSIEKLGAAARVERSLSGKFELPLDGSADAI